MRNRLAALCCGAVLFLSASPASTSTRPRDPMDELVNEHLDQRIGNHLLKLQTHYSFVWDSPSEVLVSR